jgi:hypothetical protein
MSKICTEDCRTLDVRKIKRAGRLEQGSACNWEWSRNGNVIAGIHMQVGIDNVTLSYRQQAPGGEWRDMNYPVRLAYTPCHMGGQRVWWECPGARCHRRVAVLYDGAGIFACRHCYRLAYRSQQCNNAFGPADKLRARMGWVPGIAHPPGGKPKGMHWTTYERLLIEYRRHASRAMADLAEGLHQGIA